MTYNLTNWAGGYLDLDTGVFTAETPVSRQNDKSLFLRNEKVFISRAPTVFPGATRGPQAVFGSIGEGRESPRLTLRISWSCFSPSEILPRRCNTMIVFSSCCTWTPAIQSSYRVTMEAHRARRCFYVLPSPSLSSDYVLQSVTTVCCPLPV